MAPGRTATYWSGSMASGSTSSSLLARAKAGDSEAWQRLLLVYTPLVYHWCHQAGLPPHDILDVVQEVFGSVVKSIADFRGAQPHGSFRAWLKGITRHRLLDHFRQRQGYPEAPGGTAAQLAFMEVPDASDFSTSMVAAGEDAHLSRQMLNLVEAEFEPRTWRAFWRIVVDGQKPAEVADELQMALPAVYQAKSRVLRRVRQQFSRLEPDD